MTDRYLFTPHRTPLTPVIPRSRIGDRANCTPRLLTDVKTSLNLDENADMEVEEQELFIGYAYAQGPDTTEVITELEAVALRSVFMREDWEDDSLPSLLPSEVLSLSPKEPDLTADDSEEEQEREIEAYVSASLMPADLV